MQHRILQVDADAFYVQVARLTDPEVAGRAECLLVGRTQNSRSPCRVDRGRWMLVNDRG